MEGYPKTKYPKLGGGSITVTSPEQEKQLGDNWQDHPTFHEEPPKKKRKEDPEAT
jgi:hypothetical protein